MGLSELAWTTREEVAAQLLAYLRETRAPEDGESPRPIYPTRERVAELLAYVSVPRPYAKLPELLALALDAAEELPVRRQAVLALLRMDTSVSAEDLQLLLADPVLVEEDDPCFEVSDVLRLARTPEAEEVGRTHLLTLTPEQRARVLTVLLPDEEPPGHPLGEWLYAHWLAHDRHRLEEEGDTDRANSRVLYGSVDRLESRRVLQEFWRRRSGKARVELLEILCREDRIWTFPDPPAPAEFEELVQALALPTAVLVEHLGHRELVDHLQRGFAEAEQAHMALESLLRSSAPTEQKRLALDEQRRAQSNTDHHRETRANCHLRALLTDAELASYVLREGLFGDHRWWMMEALWKRNRGLAAVTLVATLRAGDRDLARLFIRWTADAPQPGDEELLRTALHAEQSQEFRYYGIVGLDRLPGAAQGWVAVLPKLARDEHHDIRLRLRAWGVLARRGDAEAFAVLAAHAREAEDVRVRAESLSIAAEVAPVAAWPLLEEAIRCTGPEYDLAEGRFSPIVEDAALALARQGTPEACTLLLRANLRARTRGAICVVDESFAALVAELEGTAPPPPFLYSYWRRDSSLWRWPS